MLKLNALSRKAVLAVLLVLSLVIAGCGEEEKYNKAKNALLPQIEAAWKIDAPEYKDKQDWKDYNTQYEAAQKKADEAWKKIDGQVAEMQKLAESETKLNNDLINLKNQIKEKKEGQQRAFAEEMSYAKMRKDSNERPNRGVFGFLK